MTAWLLEPLSDVLLLLLRREDYTLPAGLAPEVVFEGVEAHVNPGTEHVVSRRHDRWEMCHCSDPDGRPPHGPVSWVFTPIDGRVCLAWLQHVKLNSLNRTDLDLH